MCLIHFCHQYFAKSMFSADVWKYWDSVLGHKDCLATNSKSTGLPQKSADDWNCSVDSAVRQPSLSGVMQMLTASDFCCECTTVHQVRRSSSMETSIHEPASLNRTRSVTSSQWSSSCINRDKPLSYFRVSLTTQAAEFITLCNLSVMTLGDSANTALQ